VSEVTPAWVQEILNSYQTDPQAQSLLAELAVTTPNAAGFSLDKGLIRYQGKIWVANNSAIQTKLIVAFHSSVIGGHSGVKGTHQRISQLFFWKGQKLDIENYIQQCLICQRAKHTQQHPAGLLQPLSIPDGAWQDVSMDFVEGLPSSDHYNAIVVVVDRLTKYAHFVPIKHPYTAQGIARVFLDNIVKLHGLPRAIITDRDPIFFSTFWKELFRLYTVKLSLTTAYHPQTDGQTERVNQCLEMYLRCAIHDSPKQWKNWLPLAELWYNTAFHSSLGCSPFKALYAYEPNLTLAPTITSSTAAGVTEFIQDRKQHLEALKQHLIAAQNRMKIQADKKRTDRQFQVGEKVLLKLQPYVQTSVASRPYPKLSFKYYGPYDVVERIGAVA
jgi:hypothetical protein